MVLTKNQELNASLVLKLVFCKHKSRKVLLAIILKKIFRLVVVIFIIIFVGF